MAILGRAAIRPTRPTTAPPTTALARARVAAAQREQERQERAQLISAWRTRQGVSGVPYVYHEGKVVPATQVEDISPLRQATTFYTEEGRPVSALPEMAAEAGFFTSPEAAGIARATKLFAVVKQPVKPKKLPSPSVVSLRQRTDPQKWIERGNIVQQSFALEKEAGKISAQQFMLERKRDAGTLTEQDVSEYNRQIDDFNKRAQAFDVRMKREEIASAQEQVRFESMERAKKVSFPEPVKEAYKVVSGVARAGEEAIFEAGRLTAGQALYEITTPLSEKEAYYRAIGEEYPEEKAKERERAMGIGATTVQIGSYIVGPGKAKIARYAIGALAEPEPEEAAAAIGFGVLVGGAGKVVEFTGRGLKVLPKTLRGKELVEKGVKGVVRGAEAGLWGMYAGEELAAYVPAIETGERERIKEVSVGISTRLGGFLLGERAGRRISRRVVRPIERRVFFKESVWGFTPREKEPFKKALKEGKAIEQYALKEAEFRDVLGEKPAAVLKKYLQKGKVGLGGSGAQRVGMVTEAAIPADVDLFALKPRARTEELVQAFKRAGITDIRVSYTGKPGSIKETGKIFVEGRKIEIHAEGWRTAFPYVEPYIKTPSGIKTISLREQYHRKIIGATQTRFEKDWTRGVEEILKTKRRVLGEPTPVMEIPKVRKVAETKIARLQKSLKKASPARKMKIQAEINRLMRVRYPRAPRPVERPLLRGGIKTILPEPGARVRLKEKVARAKAVVKVPKAVKARRVRIEPVKPKPRAEIGTISYYKKAGDLKKGLVVGTRQYAKRVLGYARPAYVKRIKPVPAYPYKVYDKRYPKIMPASTYLKQTYDLGKPVPYALPYQLSYLLPGYAPPYAPPGYVAPYRTPPYKPPYRPPAYKPPYRVPRKPLPPRPPRKRVRPKPVKKPVRARKQVMGYDVLVKIGKRLRKTTVRPLDKPAALRKGIQETDPTTARTFVLEESGMVASSGQKTPSLKKYRKPKGKTKLPRKAYVEKIKFAIDSPGEKRGITLKGLQALKSKSKKLDNFFKNRL